MGRFTKTPLGNMKDLKVGNHKFQKTLLTSSDIHAWFSFFGILLITSSNYMVFILSVIVEVHFFEFSKNGIIV
jgi:hypothetical protein